MNELNVRYDDSKNRIAGYDVSIGDYSKSVDFSKETVGMIFQLFPFYFCKINSINT